MDKNLLRKTLIDLVKKLARLEGVAPEELVSEVKASMSYGTKVPTENPFTGYDPETFYLEFAFASSCVEAGSISFPAFVRSMLSDRGDLITPYLKMLYNAVRDWPGCEVLGMESFNQVSEYNIDKLAEEIARARNKDFMECCVSRLLRSFLVHDTYRSHEGDAQSLKQAMYDRVKGMVTDYYVNLGYKIILWKYGRVVLDGVLFREITQRVLLSVPNVVPDKQDQYIPPETSDMIFLPPLKRQVEFKLHLCPFARYRIEWMELYQPTRLVELHLTDMLKPELQRILSIAENRFYQLILTNTDKAANRQVVSEVIFPQLQAPDPGRPKIPPGIMDDIYSSLLPNHSDNQSNN